MKKALGLPVGFPLELTLNVKPELPNPAKDKPTRSYDFTNLENFVSPSESFKIAFRDIFHYSEKESRKWLNSPNINYWSQQLNFEVWCATTGCGLSDRLLFHDMMRSEEHTSELQSRQYLVCRLLLEKKKTINIKISVSYNYPHFSL